MFGEMAHEVPVVLSSTEPVVLGLVPPLDLSEACFLKHSHCITFRVFAKLVSSARDDGTRDEP